MSFKDITRAVGRAISGTFRMTDSCTRDNTIGTFEPHQPGIHSPNSSGENRHPPAGLKLEPGNPMRTDRDEYGMVEDEHVDLSTSHSAEDCDCAYHRAKRTAARDEALEEGMETSDSLASINDKNRRRHGQPPIHRR